MAYLTIVPAGATAEIVVKKSRFRCDLTRVEDEFDARAVLEATRKEFWDARHHCAAYSLGPQRLEWSTDDGEPAGTAGAPIQQVLRGNQLTDVIAVVTRWFGGTLLGAGGLARAYADATVAAIQAAQLVQRVEQELCEVVVDLAHAGRLEHELRSRGTTVVDIDYTDMAVMRLAIPPIAVATATGLIAELTEGEAELTRRGQRWVDTPYYPTT